MGIKEYLKDNLLIFDGAMGTMLQKEGLPIGDNPEIFGMKNPDKLLKILFEKQNIQILLQVITYWINEEEYHIDFSLWKGNGI